MHIPLREPPRFSSHQLKLNAVILRLQNLMINENLTPDELVACAELVKISNIKIEELASNRAT
ncbi:hypothetical protein EYY83_13030 [Hafnia alvei]|nr:hypothetical protein EYY83_13030 [Hafnia alvei]